MKKDQEFDLITKESRQTSFERITETNTALKSKNPNEKKNQKCLEILGHILFTRHPKAKSSSRLAELGETFLLTQSIS